MKRRQNAFSLVVVLVVSGLLILPLAAEPQTPGQPNEPENPRVKTSLLVQVALQQGRDLVASGDHASAIRVLEAHLPKINGDAAYLQVLEQAYRGHIKQLREKGQADLAQRYLQKLAVFDPGITLSESVKQAPVEPALSSEATAAGGAIGARRPLGSRNAAQEDCLARSEQAFQSHQFEEAARLYERAQAAGIELNATAREQWAYCKLHWVTDQINQAAAPDWAALERETRTALSLAARTDGQLSPVARCGESLLQNISGRSRTGSVPAKPRSRFPVQHHAQAQGSWRVAETANFRILHTDAELADNAAQVAEQTRAAVLDKWLGERNPSPWPCKCDIYLHANGEAYAQATGVPAESPGHSSIGAERHDASRITSLRIDLHVDNPNLLVAVLPHETTHVALAGRFGTKPLPRWADEGMAVLSEPYERINRHLRVLPQAYQEGRAFSAGQLMTQDDYPGTQAIGAFYGQSAALVYYLTELKGPRVFVEFLRAAQREGYESSLRKHYGLDLAQLERQWQPHASAGKEIGPASLARGQN